jgi:hypothetical protein
VYRRSSYHPGVPMVALFGVITAAFAAIAVWCASSSQWLIAAAAAALAFWMGSLASAALRKMRS